MSVAGLQHSIGIHPAISNKAFLIFMYLGSMIRVSFYASTSFHTRMSTQRSMAFQRYEVIVGSINNVTSISKINCIKYFRAKATEITTFLGHAKIYVLLGNIYPLGHILMHHSLSSTLLKVQLLSTVRKKSRHKSR